MLPVVMLTMWACVCICDTCEYLFTQACFQVDFTLFQLYMQNKVQHGRWGRTEPAFREKLSLSRWLLEEERNGWNVRQGTDNSSNSLQQWLTRPGLFPWWEGNERGGSGGRKVQALPLLLFSVSVSFTHSLSLSPSHEKYFLQVKKIKQSQRGGTGAAGRSVTGFRSQSEQHSDKMRFQLFAKWEKSFSPCQVANKTSFPGWGHFSSVI